LQWGSIPWHIRVAETRRVVVDQSAPERHVMESSSRKHCFLAAEIVAALAADFLHQDDGSVIFHGPWSRAFCTWSYTVSAAADHCYQRFHLHAGLGTSWLNAGKRPSTPILAQAEQSHQCAVQPTAGDKEVSTRPCVFGSRNSRNSWQFPKGFPLGSLLLPQRRATPPETFRTKPRANRCAFRDGFSPVTSTMAHFAAFPENVSAFAIKLWSIVGARHARAPTSKPRPRRGSTVLPNSPPGMSGPLGGQPPGRR